jgi:hypothetical protein
MQSKRVIFTLLVTLVSLFIPFSLQGSDSYSDFKPSQHHLQRLTPLMYSADRFKEVASTDYVKALLTFTTESGMQQMDLIDSILYENEQSQLSWMLFFNSAVHIIGGKAGDFPLIGYYNPYSDTLLITAWVKVDGLYKIVDAEMIMGDWVRDRSEALDYTPQWLREPRHRPAELGLSLARTMLAFERVFGNAEIKDWRSHLKILKSPKLLLDINYPAVAVMTNNHLLNVLGFSNPERSDHRLHSCNRLTGEHVTLAISGDIGRTLSMADSTLSDTAQTLKSIPSEWFSSLKVANALTDNEGCLVMLSPTKNTTASISIFFKGSGQTLSPQRIDLIDYQQFYNRLKYARMQEGGVR